MLLKVERETGKRPNQLDAGGVMPISLAHVWDWFIDLHSTRSEGGIGYSEIKAWAELTGRQPRYWEIGLLRDFEKTWLRWRATRKS